MLKLFKEETFKWFYLRNMRSRIAKMSKIRYQEVLYCIFRILSTWVKVNLDCTWAKTNFLDQSISHDWAMWYGPSLFYQDYWPFIVVSILSSLLTNSISISSLDNLDFWPWRAEMTPQLIFVSNLSSTSLKIIIFSR